MSMYHQDYYDANRDRLKEKQLEYYRANREKYLAYKKEYRKKKADKLKAERAENINHIREVNKSWREKNKEKIAARMKQYRKHNAAKFTSYRSKRRVAENNFKLNEAQQKHIVAIYEEARLRRLNGEEVEVDHIVPLQSDYVCGLHVPWNLEIISKLKNRSKRNKLFTTPK